MAPIVFGPIRPSTSSAGTGPPLAACTALSSSCTVRTSSAAFLPPTPTAALIVVASGFFGAEKMTRRQPLSELVLQSVAILASVAPERSSAPCQRHQAVSRRLQEAHMAGLRGTPANTMKLPRFSQAPFRSTPQLWHGPCEKRAPAEGTRRGLSRL